MSSSSSINEKRLFMRQSANTVDCRVKMVSSESSHSVLFYQYGGYLKKETGWWRIASSEDKFVVYFSYIEDTKRRMISTRQSAKTVNFRIKNIPTKRLQWTWLNFYGVYFRIRSYGVVIAWSSKKALEKFRGDLNSYTAERGAVQEFQNVMSFK